MLWLDDLAVGHRYVETIRHPAVAQLVSAALGGRTPEALQLSPPRDPSRTIMARAAPAAAGVTHGAGRVLHDITQLRRPEPIRPDFVARVPHGAATPPTAVLACRETLRA